MIKFNKQIIWKMVPFYLLIVIVITGCAAVKPFEREKLTDPLIEPKSQFSKQSLDQKFFTSREGSIGGADGIAGGCGCAK